LSGTIANGRISTSVSFTPTLTGPAPAVNDGALRDGQPVLGLVAEPSMAL
jgi:hypothetical protein